MLKNIDSKLKDLQLYNNYIKIKKIYNRLLCELAIAEGAEGDSQRKSAAYSNVRDGSSAEPVTPSPAEVECTKRSNKLAYELSRDRSNLSNSPELMDIISKNNIEDLLYPRKCGAPLRS